MKADFEKGTKVCSRCKKELSIEMFGKDKRNSDGLDCQCKKCRKIYKNEMINTFNGGAKANIKRGQSQILKRGNVYCSNGEYNKYITKWWDGEIRHWTVNDGIWKKMKAMKQRK